MIGGIPRRRRKGFRGRWGWRRVVWASSILFLEVNIHALEIVVLIALVNRTRHIGTALSIYCHSQHILVVVWSDFQSHGSPKNVRDADISLISTSQCGSSSFHELHVIIPAKCD